MSTDDPWPPPPQPPQQPPTYGYQQPPYGQAQPPQYGYGYGYPQPPQQEGTAVAALVASIVSWVVCPVVPAIVGLVLASSAKQKIDASGGRLTGLGLVTAARWIAAIHLVLVAAVVLFLILVAVFAAPSGYSTT